MNTRGEMLDDAAASRGPVRTSPSTFVAEQLDALVRTGYAMCGNLHRAEDLVADALERSLPRWDSITGPPGPYVRRAMLNLYLNERRRESVVREEPTEQPAAGGRPAHQADPEATAAVRASLDAALSRLPDLQRAILVLRFFDDLPAEKIALMLGRPAGTIRRLTHHGLLALRSSSLFDSDFTTPVEEQP